MKKYFVKTIILLIIALSFSFVADAQIVVRIRPAAPAFRVRPVCPSPSHVWIGGNYIWRDGRYSYNDGYWSSPRAGHRWQEGYWKHRRGGWVWIPGRWRR